VETGAQEKEFARVDLAQADRFAITLEQDVVRIRPRPMEDFLPVQRDGIVAVFVE
jgi:hypothetical protein